jgi:serine/threonine-protein kinase
MAPDERPYDNQATLPSPTIIQAPREEPAVPAAGAPFGEYELLGELGRGGMGVVYKARDRSLNRVVAIKMILPGALPGPAELQRFHSEAAAAARLQHSHIVSVHRVGVIVGRPFYSMDYIEGPSLAQRLAQGPLPGRGAARYLVPVARAIHHAHLQGILHRDLKPGNILLDSGDQPRVTDFGLAKQLSTEAGQTRTGAVLGTPSYMAPEQAAGRKDLGPACDIYGLGALLYELLTGRPPFQADNPIDTLMQVIEREPAPPRLVNPAIDRDLETICLKCLAKNGKERYATAADLADDLERYVNGEAIRARSLNVMDRLARTLERDLITGEFHSYVTMLVLFAAVILAESVVMCCLLLAKITSVWLTVTRFAQFPILALIFIRYRSPNLLPRSPSERNLWSIWLGYLIAGAVMTGVDRQVFGAGQMYNHGFYAHQATAAGLAFFIMGGVYWGRFYALGAVFFGLALLMPLWPEVAPLVFGVAWTVALGLIARHLHRLATAAGQAGKPGKTEVVPTQPATTTAPKAPQSPV